MLLNVRRCSYRKRKHLIIRITEIADSYTSYRNLKELSSKTIAVLDLAKTYKTITSEEVMINVLEGPTDNRAPQIMLTVQLLHKNI
jgi:hypothetical protein